MSTKTTYRRRRAADRLRLVHAKPGYVTEEQAKQIAKWQAEADEAIAREGGDK